MGFWRFIYLFYVIITYGAVFILLKPKRIKEMLPIALVGIIVLFLTEEYLITVGLYKFPNAILPVFGIPLFHLLWAGAAAMIFMNFMPVGFSKKLLVILAFVLLTMIFEYFPEHHDKSLHLGKYSEIHDAIQDFISLILVVWFSEGFFSKRIHQNEN
jgi:hypothetical protein